MKKIVFLFLVLLASEVSAQNNQFSLLGRWAYGWSNCVTVKNDIAYTGNGAYLSLVDISDPTEPAEISHALMPATVQGIFIDGNYAYVADGLSGLIIVDINDINNPTVVGEFETNGFCVNVFVGGNTAFLANQDAGLQIVDVGSPSAPALISAIESVANDVFVEGNYAYIAHDYRGILIYDISNLSLPVLTGMFSEGTLGYSVWADGNYAYLGESQGLRIIDVTDKTNPQEVSFIQLQRSCEDIFYNEGIVYTANQKKGMNIIDVSDPASPVKLGTFAGEGFAKGVCQSGDNVFLSDSFNGLVVIDVSNAGEPSETGCFETAGNSVDLVVRDNYLFIADRYNGLQILEIGGKTTFTRIANLNPLAGYLWGDWAMSVAVEGDYVYLGAALGLYIINVADVHNPVLASHYETVSVNDVKVAGNYAYLAHPNNGFSIIDISDPGNPEQTGSITGFANAFALQGDFAYVVEENGLSVIDVSDVYNPEIKKYLNVGNSFGRDIAVKGNYAYVIGNNLSVVDISDNENPEIVGSVFANSSSAAISVSGDDAYIADNGNYQYSRGGVRVFNISNPANPFEISFYETGGAGTNLFADGTEIYLADGDDGIYLLNNDFPTGVEEEENTPVGFSLSQNYPNPFSKESGGNSATTINYSLAKSGFVSLTVFDAIGRKVADLINKEQTPGKYSVQFNAANLCSGIYFYKLETGNFRSVKKMIIMK